MLKKIRNIIKTILGKEKSIIKIEGLDREHGEVRKGKIVITEENIKYFEFFDTIIDLELNDGSKIKKGTEFLIESYKDNGDFEIHFSANEDNYYTNECGDGCVCSLKEIQIFAEPSKYSIEKYEKERGIKDLTLEI